MSSMLVGVNKEPASAGFLLDQDLEEFDGFEQYVGAGEAVALEARWNCGRKLLGYEQRQGSKNSPFARAATELATRYGVSEDELYRRRQFASKFPYPEDFSHACEKFGSWHVIVNKALASTAHLSSKKDEWATPDDLYAELDSEFHFELDVCASSVNAKCKEHFTIEDDGLSQEWRGTCWMNPPYSKIEDWMEKALESSKDGATVVCLVPARTDVGWFWEYARHGEVRLLKGRLHFTDDEGNTGPAPFASCLVVFGREPCVKWYDR